MKIGVIGCGNMGGGMIRHLCTHGWNVSCFDPSEQACAQMSALGAQAVATPEEVARVAEVVILSLPNADAVDGVMTRIADSLQPDAIILDTTTSEPAMSQAQSQRAKEHGYFFVDGPVSGGAAAAKSGTMTMLLGGDRTAIDRLQPLLDALTAKTVVVGGSGAGHAAKIVNNMLCAANLVLVGEAVQLGGAAGVAPADLLEAVNAGSGRSAVSEVNFPRWVLPGTFDSGFTMGLMRKDVRLARTLGQTLGVDLRGFQGLADVWLEQTMDIPDNADFNRIAQRTGGSDHD